MPNGEDRKEGGQGAAAGVAVRPRSLYTSYQGQVEQNLQRHKDVAKLLEDSVEEWQQPTSPEEEAAACSPADGQDSSSSSPNANEEEVAVRGRPALARRGSRTYVAAGRPSSRGAWVASQQRVPKPPHGLPIFYPCLPDEMAHYDSWRDHADEVSLGAVATPHGTISLRLRDRIRVDITLDRSIRICNIKNNIVLALSSNGGAAAMVHPNGRVWQYGSRVEIMTHDPRRNPKYAKMWYKGVSFTSEQCALVYLVDSAGTRTTTDTFSNLKQDVSVPVFLGDARHGPAAVTECVSVLQLAQCWMGDDGSDNWIVNGVRVSQTRDGLVRVGRNSNKYQMRTSPSNGTASVTTPFLHCTASMGQTSHLFVKRGERRMHYDGTSFIVRNAGHSAGFDDKNQLKVY